MTRATRTASLLAALCLLASAATARAECAWVLWIEQAELSHETWSVVWAHRTANDCSRSVVDKIKAEAAAAKKQGQDVELPGGENGNTIIRQKGAHLINRSLATSASPTPSTRAGRREGEDAWSKRSG